MFRAHFGGSLEPSSGAGVNPYQGWFTWLAFGLVAFLGIALVVLPQVVR